MQAELKERWVKALRSGDYKQGKGLLRDSDNKFCCLGVLCDLVNPDGWSDPEDAVEYYYHKLDDDDGERFDDDSLEEIGLDMVTANTLVIMNDGGDTFLEIADYIEASVE